jgi:UPF0755 protein
VTRRRDDQAGQPRLSLARRLTVMAASGLATLAIAIMVLTIGGVWLYTSPGPAARETTVILRHGAGLQEIASELENAGVISSGAMFIAAAQVTGAGRSLKAGEYDFPSRSSLADVLSKIRRGLVVRHFITIPEGLTSEQAVEVLMASHVLAGSAPVPAEGAILPETYEVTRGADRAAVLQRMISARERLVAELWPKRKAGLPFKSPEEALVLASIVEKETGKAEERPHVAGIFINRLEKGIRLESDPTITYFLTGGKPLGRGIRQSELTTPSPYNTYLVAGLPPTPICNPGRASIAAVLDPTDTKDLYFVADGTGGHAFAATLEDHNRNVARWREIERARGLRAAPAAPPAPAPARAPAHPGRRHGRR